MEVGSARGCPWGGAHGVGRGSGAASFQFFVQSRDSPPSLLAYCATLRPRTRFSGFSSPVPRIPLGRSRSCTGQVMRTVGGHYAPWTVFLFPNTAGRRANLTQPWPAEVTEILVPCHAFLALGEDSPGAERRDRSPHPGLACLSWGVPSWRARGQLFLLCSLTRFLRALLS